MHTNKRRVLIVDDDYQMSMYLVFALEHDGFECVTARNGEEALKLLEELNPSETPQLAVVDIRMPVMDGITFIRETEKRKLVPEMEIILSTGELAPPIVTFHGKSCLIFSKPFDTDKLIRFISLRIAQSARDENIRP